MNTTDKEQVRELRDRLLELFVAFVRNLDSLQLLFAQFFPDVAAAAKEFNKPFPPDLAATAKAKEYAQSKEFARSKQILDEFDALQILFIEAAETLSPDEYQEIVGGYEHILMILPSSEKEEH